MDGSRAQALAYKGTAISARKSGLPFRVFRPSGVSNPLVDANVVATLPALFSMDDYRMRRPGGYAKATWTALLDGAQTRPGDYLVEASALPGQEPRIFFVAAQQPLLPILCVACNARLTISRPGPAEDEGVGSVGYGGASSPVPIVMTFPASLLAGTKGERADDGLPRDTRQPWYAALFPALEGIEVRTDDVITDGRGYRYLVSSAELSPLGWKCSVMFAGT